MEGPRVAVVVLNWNGLHDTLECLGSLRKVEYSNFRIVVVDNGSTDGSQAAIKKNFPGVMLVENRENLGFAGGNNVGIRSVDADYYLLLNNDTVVDSKLVGELVAAGESKPDAGIVGPKIYFHDRRNVIWFAGGRLKKNYGTWHLGFNEVDAGQYDSRREVDFISGCALMVKKQVVDRIGLLDREFFIYLEDVDYCLRAKEAGFRILYEPKAFLWHKCSAVTRKTPENAAFHTEKNILLLAEKHNFGLMFYLYDLLHLAKFTAASIARLNFGGIKGAVKGKLWYLKKKLC